MLAVVPVRDGVLPAGAAEAVAECGGRAIVAGSSPADADLGGVATDVRLLELGTFDVARWAAALGPWIDDDVVVLPASPDGRDLAPRIARALGRRHIAGAVEVTASEVRAARAGGLDLHAFAVVEPLVVTLQPGIRGVEPAGERGRAHVLAVEADDVVPADGGRGATHVIDVLAPDVATMDLAEAPAIVGGGAGLDSAARFAQLASVGTALGASMGATRVITDRGWVRHERQIGTTGVVVTPRTYLAFGISGAVQHTAGLGAPDLVISVNTDAHCPMMQMADLGIVADANDVLDALAARLGVEPVARAGQASEPSSELGMERGDTGQPEDHA